MTTTAQRAAFIGEQFRVVKNGPNTAVIDKYGEAAQRVKEPIPTFFVSEADAQFICNELTALLSLDRRYFTQTVLGEKTGLDISYIFGPPTFNIIDDDRLADHLAIVSEFSINLKSDTTTIESWG